MAVKTSRAAIGSGKSLNVIDDYATIVTNNGYGGAIYTIAGYIDGGMNCRVYGNQARKDSSNKYGYGGGLYVGGTTTLNGLSVYENYAEVDGGGLYAPDGMVTLENMPIYGNAAENNGGGVYVKAGTVTLLETTLHGNTAGVAGGGLYVAGGTFVADRILVYGNTSGEGAGLYAKNGELTITGGTFLNLFGATTGGAIYNKSTAFVATGLLVSGNTATANGGGLYNTGTATISGATFTGNSSGNGGAIYSTGTLTLTASTISGNSVDSGTGYGGAGRIDGGASTFINCTITGNSARNGSAFDVKGNGVLSVQNSLIADNNANNYGSIFHSKGTVSVTGSTFSGNSVDRGSAVYSANAGEINLTDTLVINNHANYAAVYVQNSALTVTISGSTFSGNDASNRAVLWNRGSVVSISNTLIAGNRTVYSTAPAIENAEGGTLNLSNTTFSGNTCRGGAINNNGSSTDSILNLNGGVRFLTASETITNTGTLNLSGVNEFHASITGTGTFDVASGAEMVFGNTETIDVAGLTFAGSNTVTLSNTAPVNFANQNFTNAAIVIDNTDYDSGDTIVVATGIGTSGTITFREFADSFSYTVDGGTLSYSAEADVKDGTCEASFSGGTYNLMTGGTITGAFVGIRNAGANADVKTVISGGTIGNALIAGALVSSGSTATLGTVTLNISGDADVIGGSPNGGMVYVAGYAYGADPNTLDSSATLTVTKSVLNLSEGSVPAQNLYAGAHARKGAYTVVNQTEINVTGGSFGRVYGGGWAEKVGKSEVGSSEIAISGGTVDFVYAGGGNAEGGETTVTGTVDISVSDDAQVGIAFLAGKNINCTTEGAVTMTVSGDAKTMTRVSGWNANGKENTSLTTLDLQTSLNVEYLDHVDVIRIAEGKTLDVSVDLWYEAASALKIDFAIDGSLETADWTAMSGVGVELYRAAQYTIDGGDVVYTYDETSGKLVNGATESGYGLDFSEANKVKFVTIA